MHFWEAFSMRIYRDFSRLRDVVYAFLRWIRIPDMHFYVVLAYQGGIFYAFLCVAGIAGGHLLCISTGDFKYRLFFCMWFYSDIAYLVCIFAVILAYMDFEVCVYAGDPNCRQILVCGFIVRYRADFRFLRVFSWDTIGSPGCSSFFCIWCGVLRRISFHGKICMHFCGGSQPWQKKIYALLHAIWEVMFINCGFLVGIL